jgi:hypothetical protein
MNIIGTDRRLRKDKRQKTNLQKAGSGGLGTLMEIHNSLVHLQ